MTLRACFVLLLLASCSALGPAPSLAGGEAGPAETVTRYYALLSEFRYEEAQALWAEGTQKRQEAPEVFARSLSPYQAVEGRVTGEPVFEGAAGTLYATVPIRVSGTRRGEPFSSEGEAVLRRCNDVPGCSAEARRWHLDALNLQP